MTDYTLTTDEVREMYWECSGEPRRDSGAWAEFDRWLASVKADVLRDAADRWTQGAWASTPRHTDRVADRMGASQYAGDWLRAEADRIEGEA